MLLKATQSVVKPTLQQHHMYYILYVSTGVGVRGANDARFICEAFLLSGFSRNQSEAMEQCALCNILLTDSI